MLKAYAVAVLGTPRGSTSHDQTGNPRIEPEHVPKNKSILIAGLTEHPLENLEEMVFELLGELGVRMMDCDYNYNLVKRLGRWSPT